MTGYSGTKPENIRLDEDVLKTSFVFVFRKRLQDALVIRLQKTSSRRLEDVLIKTNIFVWPHVFKTSSRRFQNFFKMPCKNIFKTSSRGLANISSRRFQDVSSSETVLVNTSSRGIEHVSEIYCKDGYVQGDLPRLRYL